MVQGSTRDSKILTTGVPQGSTLGLSFSILYVDDIIQERPKNSIFSYADDTIVIYEGADWTIVKENMTMYLNSQNEGY